MFTPASKARLSPLSGHGTNDNGFQLNNESNFSFLNKDEVRHRKKLKIKKR